jgi:membrane-associated phospholipid phosphatase
MTPRAAAQTSSRGTSRGEDDVRAVRGRLAGIVVALVSAVGIGGLWYAFVRSRTGQLLDAAVLDGAHYGRTRLWRVAEPVLDVISVPFIGGVLLVAVVLAMVRRQWLLTVQVALLMVAANLTSQLLKYAVLDRPDLGLGDRVVNTMPSGHTTAAASCAVALVLVVPRRLRPLTAALGAAYTAGTGIATLIGGWHRPSDVVAAMLVVLAWAGLVSALRPTGPPASAQHRRRETSTVSMLLALGLVATGAAAVTIQRTALALRLGEPVDLLHGLESRADLLTAYGGGALGITAASLMAFGVLLLLLRGHEPKITEPR